MRWKYLILALVLAILCVGMPALVQDMTRKYGLREAAVQSHERLKLISATLSTRIERFRYLPDVVARSSEIEDLFRSGMAQAKRPDINRFLARLADASGAVALYVTDTTGLAIASSNYDTPDSFVGHDYSYRPYFRDAMANGNGGYYAIGATTGQPGYFLSVPIKVDDRVVGVSIVKIDLLPVEKQWHDAGEEVAMTDSEGIIFLSSRPDWRYTATVPISPTALAQLKQERRYGDAALAPKIRVVQSSGFDLATVGNDGASEQRLQVKAPFGEKGWTLIYFADLADIRRQDDIVAVATALAGLLVLAGITIAVQRRRGRLAARRAFEQLEHRVAERTQQLKLSHDLLEREIAERKEAERQLSVTRSNLSQAEKLALIGQAFAGLAHEINQPLAALSTYIASTRLLLKRKQYEPIEENIDTMNEVVGRISDLTGQLKRLARRSDDEFVDVDLGAIVKRTLKLLKFRFSDLGINVSQDIDARLKVQGSAAQLEQVVLNLLTNAVDAVRHRKDPAIHVSGRADGAWCMITVDDNGPGIAAEMGTQLFEPFYTTKLPGEGLGLGLATAHRIANDHGGSLSFDRSPLGGASFVLRLRQNGSSVSRRRERSEG
ncbi:ATP-binding protein [Rhizobium sp. BK602]|uniref:sensor histidine kinase n=1 Tax=Rhizobium sp. BK602 TaxID=2586986 RepID=UPI0017C1EEFF|nr:ATP-binding protein [Rhizobium sp. BK602]MBB3612530.1 two-component system C4-dicarboxylate transport sensor histidine kinase DctB [Rhizobium sp. BK602]